MFNFFHKKDDQIQKDVSRELLWDPSVDSDNIVVSIKNGAVTLSGHVPHFYQRYNAEDAARRVGGVKSVEDKTEVTSMDGYTRTDGQITDAAQTALKWNYQIPDGLKVITDGGVVTLTGQVDWEFQRAAAFKTVSTLMGVCGVENDITIKPKQLDSADVKNQIQDALKRSATVEGRNIEVTVSGGKVTLSGSLDSYSEIETARIAAWNAPGVMNVVNELSLIPQI